MSTGEKIEKLAKLKGFNIKQLALSAGVNYSTLYSLVKRKSSFANRDLIEKVSRVLGVDPETLLDHSSCIGTEEVTEAEIKIFNTINAMASLYCGKERDDFLYFLNSLIETNGDWLVAVFNKMKKEDDSNCID